MTVGRIIGTGSYVPARVLTNDELAQKVDTSDEWIVTRTGIRERRIAADDEQASDLATHAAKKALEMAGIRATDLGLIVVGTVSGDMPMPACAAFLQNKLGAKCPAFDVSAACAGSLFGLSIAEKFIVSGAVKYALVVGVEMLSRIVDWSDRNTCVLFGDAAGAMILGVGDASHRILSTQIHTDGTQTGILNIPGGGSMRPADYAVVDERLNKIKMNGREVYKFAVRCLVDVAESMLREQKLTASDVRCVIPHQANIRIVDAILERLEIPRERAVSNIERYGNTSSASVPITFDEAVRTGRIQSGDLFLMMAVGAGMSWGGALVRW